MQKEVFIERWQYRIQKTRKKYFFHHFMEVKSGKEFFYISALKQIYADFVYVQRNLKMIFYELKIFGKQVKRISGLSYSKQLYRYFYLVFVERVYPSVFRSLHLFKDSNWLNVNKFTYSHYKVQQEFASLTYPGEVPVFLNKFEFFLFCSRIHIPTPKVISVFEKGMMIYPDTDVTIPSENLFIKERDGQMGEGIKKLTYSNGLYADKYDKKHTADQVTECLLQKSAEGKSWLLQEYMENHVTWKGFTNGSLATCRVVTAKCVDYDKIKPLVMVFRMPTGEREGDNFSLGSILSNVDLKTGRLSKAVGSIPLQGAFEHDEHPDTGCRITGEILPFWSDLLYLSMDMHKKFKSAFIGWDVSMTTQGSCVTEGSLFWNAGSIEIACQIPMILTGYPVMFEQWIDKFGIG